MAVSLHGGSWDRQNASYGGLGLEKFWGFGVWPQRGPGAVRQGAGGKVSEEGGRGL